MLIQSSVLLAPLSTFHIGGSADYYIKITSEDTLQKAIYFSHTNNIPYFCLGGGSNILFSDSGFRGIIFHFAHNMIQYNNEQYVFEKGKYRSISCVVDGKNTLRVDAGARMMEVYVFCKQHQLDFSIFSTIPGTLGGAVAGNAGLPNAEIQDIVQGATLFDTQEQKMIYREKDFFDFSYRHSIFHTTAIANRYIIWSIDLMLPYLETEKIDEQAKQYMKRRKEKQPWGKTGGSFFRNPPEGAAGMFLEKAGYKGKQYNGAFFSEKHANFMMNDGSATQEDILFLAREAKKTVFDRFGIVLHNEVRILNEYGEVLVL